MKCSSKQFAKGIKKAFKSFDTDGDGSLTFKELTLTLNITLNLTLTLILKEFLPVYNFLFVSEMNFDDV